MCQHMPVVGNIVFVTCGCQLPCRDCNDSTPVLCTLDFIKSLDITHTCQVVFVHDPRGCSSGFYYMYRNNVNVVCLHVCHDEDLGPFQVIESKMAKVVFCSQTFLGDLNGDLTPNQVFDDYKRDLWSRVNYSMDYTEYIETIIDKLCAFMDLQTPGTDFEVLDAPNDTTNVALIPSSITAFLVMILSNLHRLSTMRIFLLKQWGFSATKISALNL